MAFKSVEEAKSTMQPGDRVVSNGYGLYLVESPAPTSLVSSRFQTPAAPRPTEKPKREVGNDGSTTGDMGRPMTRGERAAEDVLEARESGRRPGVIKSAVAFLYRRGIIR